MLITLSTIPGNDLYSWIPFKYSRIGFKKLFLFQAEINVFRMAFTQMVDFEIITSNVYNNRFVNFALRNDL